MRIYYTWISAMIIDLRIHIIIMYTVKVIYIPQPLKTIAQQGLHYD